MYWSLQAGMSGVITGYRSHALLSVLMSDVPMRPYVTVVGWAMRRTTAGSGECVPHISCAARIMLLLGWGTHLVTVMAVCSGSPSSRSQSSVIHSITVS